MPTYFLERGCWWQVCACVCTCLCCVDGSCVCACVCRRVCACVGACACVRVCVRAHVREHVCAWLFLTGIVRILTLKMVGFFQECWPFFFFFCWNNLQTSLLPSPQSDFQIFWFWFGRPSCLYEYQYVAFVGKYLFSIYFSV